MLMSPLPRNSKRAFTLIELSIVLVIIGLIVGGIFVTADMIDASKVRSQISQVEQYTTAVNTFKLKYGCIPGDCANATQFFGSATQPDRVTNGNGDGMIQSLRPVSCGGCVGGWAHYVSTYANVESMRVFDHLAISGLFSFLPYDETVAGTLGVSYPHTVFRSTLRHTPSPNHHNVAIITEPTGVVLTWISDPNRAYMSRQHFVLAGLRAVNNAGHPDLFTDSGFQPWDAHMMDVKTDDGKPLTGKTVLIMGSYNLTLCATSTSPDTAEYRSYNNLSMSWGVGVQNSCGIGVASSF